MKSNVLIGLGLGAFLFSPSTSHAQKAKEAKTPNVIFIYADDLGYLFGSEIFYIVFNPYSRFLKDILVNINRNIF